MNVASCYNDKMDSFKSDKKLGFDNIVDINFDKGFKLSIVQLFQDIKISNVEKLYKIRWIYREVESDDVFLFAEFFELDWEMALIAI